MKHSAVSRINSTELVYSALLAMITRGCSIPRILHKTWFIPLDIYGQKYSRELNTAA